LIIFIYEKPIFRVLDRRPNNDQSVHHTRLIDYSPVNLNERTR